MTKYFLLTSSLLILTFACSKKNDDTPSPAPNNQNNTGNNNQGQNNKATGIYYTFKGTKYKMDKLCGGASSYSGSFGYNIAYTECGSNEDINNFFTSETFDLTMFKDSSSLSKIVGKKYKQFNGYFIDQKLLKQYGYGNRCDTLNLQLTLSNPNLMYKSFSCLKRDTVSSTKAHYFTITSSKFKTHTYNSTTLLLSGEFNIRMVNDRDSTDLTSVSGYFNDLQYTFDRK